MQTTAQRLEALRRLAGNLSRRKAGALCGLSAGYFTAMETRTSGGNAKELGAVARAFGVSLDWLILGQGDAPTAEEVQASVRTVESRGAVEHAALTEAKAANS